MSLRLLPFNLETCPMCGHGWSSEYMKEAMIAAGHPGPVQIKYRAMGLFRRRDYLEGYCKRCGARLEMRPKCDQENLDLLVNGKEQSK